MNKNMIIDILKKSYRDPNLPREVYPEETQSSSIYEEKKYNPYGSNRGFDREDRKLDEKIVQQLNSFKYRGPVKDIMFRICKLGGFLPNELTEWIQEAFYKFATDKVLTYNYYPKVKRFLDMFGKSTSKNIGLKNFIVIKNNSIRASAFIDRTSAVNFGTMVCTSGLFEKIKDEDMINVLLAYETAKGLLEQRDISMGFALIVSIVLTIAGNQLYKVIKKQSVMIPSYKEIKDLNLKAYNEKVEKIQEKYNENINNLEEEYQQKVDSVRENDSYSEEKKQFIIDRIEKELDSKNEKLDNFLDKDIEKIRHKDYDTFQYKKDYIPTDKDDFLRYTSGSNIFEKGQVFWHLPKDDKMEIIMKEVAPFVVSAAVLTPILKWLFGGITGMQKEADLMSINVLLKTFGNMYDMNNVFLFHKMYKKTFTGSYALNTSSEPAPESLKRMQYIYDHLVEIGYDVSKITEYNQDGAIYGNDE